jgi:hypothetical protein
MTKTHPRDNDQIRMYARPVDKGQIVEVSYGYDYEGGAYRRTLDRSDRSVSWEHGELDWDREPEHEDHDRIPCVLSWETCEDPTA